VLFKSVIYKEKFSFVVSDNIISKMLDLLILMLLELSKWVS